MNAIRNYTGTFLEKYFFLSPVYIAQWVIENVNSPFSTAEQKKCDFDLN